jgi:hypothetical protein
MSTPYTVKRYQAPNDNTLVVKLVEDNKMAAFIDTDTGQRIAIVAIFDVERFKNAFKSWPSADENFTRSEVLI